MRIKRFIAPDMRAAFRMVREEQGPNAVILSNRRVEGGVEVVAATDYDEALAQQALKSATAATRAAQAVVEAPVAPTNVTPITPVIETIVEAKLAAKADKAQSVTLAEAPSVKALWTEDPNLAQMRRELTEMRKTIETEMARFTDERLKGTPSRAAALEELLAYGCEEALARQIASMVPADAEPRRARAHALGLLAKSLPPLAKDPLVDGGVIALVGPTGVGKTTTLAKLAARYARMHSPRDVALVSTDSYRIGAREQLYIYGRRLGMPVIEADSAASLADALQQLADYKLVLIDTAGMGQRDAALAAQLAWLREARQVKSYLVLPANAQPADLDEVVRRFKVCQPQGVILTKVDETGRLGAALSVTIRQRLPIAYVADGQRVPEDLHAIEPHKLVLRASELKREAEMIAKEDSSVAA